MGEKTAISWAHHTFNPWRGCTHATGPKQDTARAGQQGHIPDALWARKEVPGGR